MDFDFRNNLGRFRAFVSKRVRDVRENDSSEKRLSGFALRLTPQFKLRPRLKLHPRWRSAIFGISFLSAAAILAWGAQEISYSRAFQDWERHRLPSEKTWVYSLGSMGWHEAASNEVTHKALRKLPAMLDSAGTVWASPDFEWLVIFIDPLQTIPQKIFCRDCQKAPERFETLGAGWSGFDQVMARLEKAKARVVVAAKVRKTYKFVDAREIHY